MRPSLRLFAFVFAWLASPGSPVCAWVYKDAFDGPAIRNPVSTQVSPRSGVVDYYESLSHSDTLSYTLRITPRTGKRPVPQVYALCVPKAWVTYADGSADEGPAVIALPTREVGLAVPVTNGEAVIRPGPISATFTRNSVRDTGGLLVTLNLRWEIWIDSAPCMSDYSGPATIATPEEQANGKVTCTVGDVLNFAVSLPSTYEGVRFKFRALSCGHGAEGSQVGRSGGEVEGAQGQHRLGGFSPPVHP